MKLKYFIGLFLFLSVFFVLPKDSFASTLVVQGIVNATTTYNTSIDGIYQSLGSNLTGYVDSFAIQTVGVTAGTENMRVILNECTDSSYNTCTVIVNSTVSHEAVQYVSDQISYLGGTDFTRFSFNPIKYYRMYIRWISGAGISYLQGDSTDVYPNGSFYPLGYGLVDLSFVFLGVQTVADSSYTYNAAPDYASTTSSTQVTVGFSYHAVAADSIISYSINFQDISDFVRNATSTLDTSTFSLTGDASTGDSSVYETITLSSGHTYSMNAWICADINDFGTCHGGASTQFTVVGDPNAAQLYLNIPNEIIDNLATSTVCTQTNVLIKYPCIAVYTATSFLFKPNAEIVRAMYNEFASTTELAPFGYSGAIKNLLYNLSTTTSTSTAFLYLQNLASTTPVVGSMFTLWKVFIGAIGWVGALWIGLKTIGQFT